MKRYYFCNPKRRGSDEVGTRNDEREEGNEVERGIKIFENNGTKVADGLF